MVLKDEQKESIKAICDIDTFNEVVITICNEYLSQHPEPTPYWNENSFFPNLLNTHRSQDTAKTLIKDVNAYKNGSTFSEQYEYSNQLLSKLSGGTLTDAIRECVFSLIENNEQLKELDSEADAEFIREFADLTPFG